MMSRVTTRLTLPALALCLTAPMPGAQEDPTYTERYRPQYHFSPAKNWMNDPNGLVFHRGEYHLFYQHNPFGNTWGHMSWGHAVSPDLVHWTHLPVAIPEENGVMAFSGSAVVDWKNTSGFGTTADPPIVAIYTAHREGNQSQYIAYSTDRGRTFTRYTGNPVLDIGKVDFRDPKVFWYGPEQKWVMAVSLSPEYKVHLYSSPDLKRWTFMSEFGPSGATGGIWECPDLFELRVDGDPQKRKWVLIVNLNPGGVAGGSGVQYFLGDFDGTRFTADSVRGGYPLWADYGMDYYAAVSWSDIPASDGRRIWIGWMNNWLYGNEIPTHPWRSAQSIPRTLHLRTTPDGIRLVQRPVVELRKLRGQRRELMARTIPAGFTPLGPHGIVGRTLEIDAEFEVGSASEFGLKVRTGSDEETVIGIDPRSRRLFVDRSRSGDAGFHKDFHGRQSAPLNFYGGRVRLRVFVDWSSVEVFANDGEAVITDRIFPSPGSTGVQLYAIGGNARLRSLEAWPLKSIWEKEQRQARAGGGGGER